MAPWAQVFGERRIWEVGNDVAYGLIVMMLFGLLLPGWRESTLVDFGQVQSQERNDTL